MNPVQHWVARSYQRLMFAGLCLPAMCVIGLMAGSCGRDEGKPQPAKQESAKQDSAKGQPAKGRGRGKGSEAKKAQQPPPKGLLTSQDNGLRNQLGVNVTTEYKGGRLRTNQWGMRDKDYQLTPPPATRRIAVLGTSHVFGAGVHDGETFEQLVEDRLNREVSPRSGLKFEFLNFAVPNYTLMQHSLILSNGRVGDFQPDVVMIVGHLAELRTIPEYVWRELQAGRSVQAPADQVVKKAGVTGEMAQADAVKRLTPYSEDLAAWALKQAAADIRRMGAEPLYALIPAPGKWTANSQKEARLLLSLAQAAGFLTLDLKNVYQGADIKQSSDLTKLQLSATDRQPNAEGHRIIAGRLYAGLTKMPAVLAADSPETAKKRAAARATWSRDLAARKKAEETRSAKAAKPAVARAPIEGWAVEAPDGGLANLESSRQDNWMRVTISRLPKSPSSRIKLRRASVPITSGQRYVLSLWIKADANRPVGCGVAEGVAPWAPLGESTTLQAVTWWQEFSCAFTATGTKKDAQIFIDLGSNNTALEFTNIQLKNQSTGQVVMSTDPAWRGPGRSSK